MRKFLIFLLFLAFCTMGFAAGKAKPQHNKLFFSPKSDVFMQGFYWDSPPGEIWWDSLAQLAPRLASAGFSAIWFPSPVKGAAGDSSMGYDPYDHYDFGEFNQRGSIGTRFGTRQSLVNSIQAYHDVGINVFADAVMLFMNGGEETQRYQCTPSGFTWPDSESMKYTYPYGSGRFPKDSTCFYPNALHCDVNSPYHGPTDLAYKFGPWLDKDPGPVRDSLVVWGQYMKNVIGFDGFRLDAVKSIDPVFMGYWLSQVNTGGYAVAEDWASSGEISGWLNTAVANGGGSLAMFDFDLRYALQSMCNSTDGSYNMTYLDGAGLVHSGMSGYNVATFVENHDMDRIGWDGNIDGSGHNPIITDKILAYAYTIFSEGRPCVFFKDYFMYGLGSQIDTLIWIRRNYLGGGTTQRSGLNAYYIRQDAGTDQSTNAADIYVARRDGYGSQPGGYIVINDNATQWMDVWVDTDLPVGAVLKDYTGRDGNKTVSTPSYSGGKNRVKLWAPKRSYTIYVADTTQTINHPPVFREIPNQLSYTNKYFAYQTLVTDADNDSLTYSLTNNPGWLSISSSGLLAGTPVFADTATTDVIVTANDNHGSTVSDTFSIRVKYNRRPVLSHINDTTISVTKRYQFQVGFSDPDGDTLVLGFTQSPTWLNIGTETGIISGTPDISDVGIYAIKISASDGKGGEDSLSYNLTVSESHDTVIATYGKPTIDGHVDTTGGDWAPNWLIMPDSPTDSKWWTDSVHLNNELYGLYATWDADSLYVGVNYFLTDSNNTMMLYIDAGISGGQTNFNSHQGYSGDYPKNNRFRASDGIDYFVADYRYDKPHLFKTVGTGSTNLDAKLHSARGAAGHDAEIAVAWDDLYGLGAGLVPPNVKLKFVALMAGGDNWGSGDSCPDNPDVDGNSGPDSLINFATIMPDTNSDGIPDPTVYIDTVISPVTIVSKQESYPVGWNIISVPLKMTDYRKSVLFPHAATSAFYYDRGYHTIDTLRNNFGYWLKFSAPDTEKFQGVDRTLDTITVRAGWNLVGSLAYPVSTSSIIQSPTSIINSNFYYFDGTYKQALTLQPGAGYWVKVTADGKLILTK